MLGWLQGGNCQVHCLPDAASPARDATAHCAAHQGGFYAFLQVWESEALPCYLQHAALRLAMLL